MCEIVGRKQEIEELKKLYNSKQSEFVAVYGRRRVGKTFLVKEVFRDVMTFSHTGLSPIEKSKSNKTKDQLQNFYYSLIRYGLEGQSCPKNWLEAFFMLEQLLDRLDNGTRQVVFIDELPWMDTARSGFVTALEAFWNGWGASRRNLLFVVCGSATSWIVDNLINNKGGLYNRLTSQIKLSPFTLRECREFYNANSIKMSDYDVIQAYMTLGGIPYYMNYFNRSLSLAQNIDKLFFCKNPKLTDEFDRLFGSLFINDTVCKKIIKCLFTRHYGYMRDEIAKKVGISNNGDLSNLLKALIASDFVEKYVPFGYSERNVHYKLSDPFCWFWITFVEGYQGKDEDYWAHKINKPEYNSWKGIAFEEICFNHAKQIKSALGIGSVSSKQSAYIVSASENNPGMQIDMVIERADNVVNICEMKFYKDQFTVDKSYDETLRRRTQQIEEKFPKLNVHTTLITTFGLRQNEYSNNFQSVVTIEDLMK
ncbi:MAG: ATP-binding protein [Paludibacteraceae bacterium]|nr:ATP-binding protein [Paludibacteraceae bacterium]